MTDATRRAGRFPLRLERMVRAPKVYVGPLGVSPNHAHEVTRDVVSEGHASGLGLDSDDIRRRMIDRLRTAGPHHARVLAAMGSVPRHRFVDAALATQAYEDTSLPIGHGQTISKPSVVARMLDVLMDGAQARAVGHLGRVLEIGTGCGYQAAVLCRLAQQVVSIERVRGLYDKARELVAPLRTDQLRLVYGDGMVGHAPNAPYDSIIAAACGVAIPNSWLDQLAVGGRLISPVGDAHAVQKLIVVDRTQAGLTHTEYEAVQFVPLKSGLL